jgi:Na+-transporting NADH:ubiquinone oxidoreductase subunit C
MPNTVKSIILALVLCLIIGTLLSVASIGLKSRQLENIFTDRRKNILKSVGLVNDEIKYTPDKINALYAENIKQINVTESGMIITDSIEKEMPGLKILPIYLYIKSDSSIESYIIPIDTKGLWGKIHGYLSLKTDGSTINRFTVYKHAETPGLGGEIEKNWFQNNFAGKKIVNREGLFVSLAISKGKAQDSIPEASRTNFVDGISGATLTGKFLTQGLKETLAAYEPISIRFRKNNFRNYTEIEKKIIK